MAEGGWSESKSGEIRSSKRRHNDRAEKREPKATARSRTCAVRSQSVIRPEGPEMPRRG